MASGVRLVIHHDEIHALVSSPAGPVALDLVRRGNNVRNSALANMRAMGIGTKTGTGALAQSIQVELVQRGGMLVCRVGSRLKYAIYVHEGHGEIRPVRARILRWPATASSGSPRRYRGGKTAQYVFARRVRPVAGRPFLLRALPAASQG